MECEELYEFYSECEKEKKIELLKAFSIYNVQASALGARGTKSSIEKFIRDLQKEEESEEERENDLDDQFKGVDFG